MMKFNYKYNGETFSVSAPDADRAYCRLKAAVLATGSQWSGKNAKLVSIGNAI